MRAAVSSCRRRRGGAKESDCVASTRKCRKRLAEAREKNIRPSLSPSYRRRFPWLHVRDLRARTSRFLR
jgi:hypothetical protein